MTTRRQEERADALIRLIIGALVYLLFFGVAACIFAIWLHGDPWSWLFAAPFIAGYLAGRITKTTELL